MRRRTDGILWLLLVAMALPGCGCEPPSSADDAGAPDDAALVRDTPPPLDAGNPFLVPDAGEVVGPACTDVEHRSSPLPVLDEGQRLVRLHGDRILVISRPNSPPPPYTTMLRFYGGVLGDELTLIGEHTFDRNVGLVQAARFRDGAWDVVVDVFSHEGLAIWLRVTDEGAIEATEHRGPGTPQLETREVFEAGEDFVVLSREIVGDERVLPTWISRLEADGSDEHLRLADPDRTARQVVVRARPPRVLLFEHDAVLGRPPRIAPLSIDPLGVPEDTAFRAIAGEYPRTGGVEARLFGTPSGLVMGELVVPTGETATLRLAWLDDAFDVTARWAIETVVVGSFRVAGAFPTQEIVVTLPDSPSDRFGPATVFHGRATAPGAVSSLSPIGRALAVYEPELVVHEDGRVDVVHFDDRIDVERVCEAP